MQRPGPAFSAYETKTPEEAESSLNRTDDRKRRENLKSRMAFGHRRRRRRFAPSLSSNSLCAPMQPCDLSERSCIAATSYAPSRMDRAPAKLWSRPARNRFGPRKGQGWGLPFCLPYLVSPFVGWTKARSHSPSKTGVNALSPTLYIPLGLTAWASLRSAPPCKNEGSGTPANADHSSSASCDAARALRSALICRRSTAALT